MTEYIERGAAIDAIMKVYVRTAGYKARERVFEAEEAVHRLPVADVAPVVHGNVAIGKNSENPSKKRQKISKKQQEISERPTKTKETRRTSTE